MVWRTLAVASLLWSACSSEPEPPSKLISSVPLRERTAADGTRFRRLDPAVSGLAFQNELRKENVVPYVYSGAGVAIGDYDDDGLPDVYLVSQDGANKLFKQVAPLRFEDVTDIAGGLDGGDAWGSAASFADVDGDKDLDLYVCNTESPNLLYLNQGDGTFLESGGVFGLAHVAASSGAAFADYDNDGDLDLYLLTNRVYGPILPEEIVKETTLPGAIRKTHDEMFPPYPRFEHRDGTPIVPPGYEDFYFEYKNRIFVAAQSDRLFRNDGYAKWRDVTDAAGIADHGSGLSATWWDCDGDGWLDLYVSNDLESPDKLYRNRGDGTFEDIAGRALPHTAFFGMGSDFGDINNDGRFDYCGADMSSTTHYMSKMLMGSMGTRRWYLMNAEPRQYMRNALFVNSGTERFHEAAHLAGLASTDWTWTVRFADLDNDGWVDFFASNGIPIFEDNPDTVAEFKRLWGIGAKEQALNIARNLERVEERNIVKRNLGDLKFENVAAAWGLDEKAVNQGAAIADLDRDGDLDVVINNQNTPASVYENRDTQAHRILVALRGTRANYFGVGSRVTVEAGGITQTRLVVLTRGYMSAGEAIAHFGLGAHDRIERLRVSWPDGAEQEFYDLQADRFYTILESEAASALQDPPEPEPWFRSVDAISWRHTERPFDDYAVQPLLPHRLSKLGPGIAWSDVNGDARDDVWIGGATGQAGTLMLATVGGGFEAVAGPFQADAEHEDMGAVFFDCDRDGDLDLYVVSGGVEPQEQQRPWQDRLYLNDGSAQFSRAEDGAVPPLNVSGSSVCAADYDRDGDLDLFVAGRTVPGRYPEAPPSTVLRNDDGRLVDVTTEVAPQLASAGMVTGAVWSDLDGDAWQDLVVVAQWQPVRVFRNDAGKVLRDATADLGLDGLRGQWNGVAAGDLDADGDMDLVVTNLGLNTKYKAKADHPMRIYGKDFDSNGSFDIVEAKYEGNRLLPVRGRSCSSEAMPFIADKFPTYDAFARATLVEIYGNSPLGGSLELVVNELQTLILENRGDGFTKHPLPRLAQISPGFGIGIADYDGDGILDIAIAQNFYSPEPETGHFDGGLGIVLAGRGGLRFEPLPAHRSGVVMPEDAMGLSVTDVDGDSAPDFVCTTNDGPVRTFLGKKNPASLAVRLAGMPGNPAAIGSRLELVSPDGATQVRELRAGSGYLAQSSSCAFFSRVAEGSQLRVRWPDGESTEHRLQVQTGPVTLSR